MDSIINNLKKEYKFFKRAKEKSKISYIKKDIDLKTHTMHLIILNPKIINLGKVIKIIEKNFKS